MTSNLNRSLSPEYAPGTNLPKEIIHPQGVIRNYYTAGGAKTGKKLFDPRGTLLYHEQYYGDLVVKDGSPTRILHADGVINLSSRGVEFTYHLKDHTSTKLSAGLGNVRVVIAQDENLQPNVLQVNDYYPFGMVHTTGVGANKYLYNGKEEQEMPGKWRDYGARFYDPQLGRWNVVDPRAEKYYSLTPYNYCANNPILYIDPQGDTIVVSNTGYIMRNDKTDNLVYMQDGKNFTQIGELGKKIDANTIYSNLLEQSVEEAEKTWNPLTFKNNVKTGGKWDLKNDKNSIFGLGNDGKTTFSFQGESMESQDIGNHHFGVVAKAYGLFPSEEFVLKQAGDYQIKSGTSKSEWQQYKTVTTTVVSPTGAPMTTTTKVMLPPYGDDPRDQSCIKAGFLYYKKRF